MNLGTASNTGIGGLITMQSLNNSAMRRPLQNEKYQGMGSNNNVSVNRMPTPKVMQPSPVKTVMAKQFHEENNEI